MADQAVKFGLGAMATVVGYGFLIEAPWSRRALLVLGLAAGIRFVMAAVAMKRHQAFNASTDDVVRALYCPTWYLASVREQARQGGFEAELEHRLDLLGDRPSGIRVMNAFQLARRHHTGRPFDP